MVSFSFSGMPPVHFGAGKLSGLPRIARAFGCEALLVTGKASLESGGHLERVLDGLKAAGFGVRRIIIAAEPSTEFIDRTCADLRAGGAPIDVVIGIGGGSVIDGAKAISAMLPHRNSVFDHLEDVGSNLPHSGVKVPYVAVPTTSGTGGEMTKNAVLSMVGPGGYKKSLRHDNLIPDAVIVDPELMLTCPPHVTAACGMDAFTQLLEPYLSPLASPLSDALAWSGLEKAREHLVPAATDRGGDLEVRAGMAYASLLSGAALANAGLGLVHGLASPIGGFFEIPHGVVCGTVVAEATAANLAALRGEAGASAAGRSATSGAPSAAGSSAVPGDPRVALAKYAKVGILFGGDASKGEAWNCDFLVERLHALTEALRLPRLSEYGISERDLDRIVAKASNRQNPVKLSPEAIRGVLARRL
jgi:alcohol dehydrogenase